MRFTELLAVATLGLAGSSSAFSPSRYGDLETRDEHQLRVAYQRSLDGLETRQPARLKIGGILDSKKLEKLRKSAKKKTSKPKKAKSKSKKPKKNAKKIKLKKPPGLKTGKGGGDGTSTAYGNGDGIASTAYNRRSIELETRRPMPLKIGIMDKEKLEKMKKATKKPKKTTDSKKANDSKKPKKSKKKVTLKKVACTRTGKKGTFKDGSSTAYQN
ncbi:unnamed protein product [Clonostachys chloroleuca]|uniref:Uncharacterized protein n=1 Tax=Clonostachys chloroleuca TaxID=1926264 RepID=A0AA35LX71_9HYPO|nr:unnamed protein product [Clonostachys chloroleuca]